MNQNEAIPFTDKARNNLTGQTFGKLTVIAYAGQSSNTSHKWHCRCECGKEKTVLASNLRAGRTRSCGCLMGGTVTHGHAHRGKLSPEYGAWKAMRNRCNNASHHAFKYYGGRGVKVCERWQHSFEAFLADMGLKPQPTKEYTLDRIDNENGIYEPGNCKWSTWREQRNNMRSNITVTLDGKTQTLMQWIREFELPVQTIYSRIFRGWTPEEALKVPVAHKINHYRI